ncbi:MAG: hypothetical protein GY717_01900, partial [Rhodobacteraceae bacterium]|nr:hypothetical protein [Paracoccaceae bacterium]
KEQHPEVHAALTPAQKTAFAHDSKWVCDVLHVGTGKSALRYLARYVRCSALTDRRILGYDRGGKVRVSWTCSDTGKRGILTLHPHELIRRWLLHVLPRGFTRLRHYGFMAGAAKETRLRVRALLGQIGEPAPDIPEREPFRCEHCQGELAPAGKIEPVRKRGPPAWKHIPERQEVTND